MPGALTWNELTTRDVEGSKAFYGSVFGWMARDTAMGSTPYVVWELDGQHHRRHAADGPAAGRTTCRHTG